MSEPEYQYVKGKGWVLSNGLVITCPTGNVRVDFRVALTGERFVFTNELNNGTGISAAEIPAHVCKYRWHTMIEPICYPPRYVVAVITLL